MATNDHSGYPLKWFKDQNAARNAYECAICLDVLKDPVQVRDCGHQFCALCIEDILKIDPLCPTCRIEISDMMIFEDHAARRLIRQLVVNCCNEGCSWQGCLSSLLQGHQNNCNFSIHRGDNVDKKVEKLEQTLETLVLKISTLEKKYEQDSKELKLKYEQDSKELKLKHEQDIKEVKLKHEQDIKELKLKLEQSENRWQLLEEKQKELCEKEKKTALRQSENRWQRPKEKEKELSEERKTAGLYRNVMAMLNKLTPQKFKPLVPQFMALNIDTPERLEGVIDRIFEKAVGEPMYSVAYANMCRCLFLIKVADAEGEELLLNRCQKEFETQKENEQALLEKHNQLEGLSEKERKIKEEEIDEALAKNKRRMLGNIKFIGELFKLKLLTENIMHDCIYKLLRAGDEESLESMCKLLFTIGKYLDSDRAKFRIDQYFVQINWIIVARKVSSRVIFMLRDVVELRQNKWVPRREEHYNPKTIRQIHKEAQMKKIQEQRLAGGPGGRDSPKPTSNYGWIPSGKGGKSVPIDQNTLRSMAKRANTEKISLGPSARFGQWDRYLNNSSQEQDRPSPLSGGDMPSSRPYDPRRSSASAMPFLAGLWGSDESRIKSDKDRENALEPKLFVEDMGEKSGDEIKVESENYTAAPVKQSRRKYEREFLLQLQYMPVCLKKPAGLPDMEIVLDAPHLVPPRNRGGSQRGGSDFVPSFARQKSQGGGGRLAYPYFQYDGRGRLPPPVMLPAPSQEKDEVKEALSEEELGKKTAALIDEYANIRDLTEAIACFTDLHSPNLHHLFILTAVEHTYEMSSRARYDTGKLFAELLSQNKLSKEQFSAGFNSVLEVAYDNAIDYSMLWKYLAEIITPVILGGLFTLSDLKPQILEYLIPVGKAATLLAEILLITKELKGESKAVQIWTDLGISWSQVLPRRLTKEDFLSRKNLHFLPNEKNVELLKLLRADQFKNDTVIAYIEKNFKEEERKEARFISQLVTAIAESCIINKDQEFGPDCCQDKLKARKDILRKYLDNNYTLELQALFALQEIYVKYNKPAAMLSQFFNTLYDEEVITEEAFMTWKQDENPLRQEDKGPALQATALFFEWLQSAAVEGSEN